MAATVSLASASTPAAAVEAGDLRVEPERSTDGVYQVRWTSPEPVRLEESRQRGFQDPVVIYEGVDQATTLSGREDGTYYYRLAPAAADRTAANAPVVSVEVDHHSLPRALGFFAAGAVVFVSTVALIVSGERKRNDG